MGNTGIKVNKKGDSPTGKWYLLQSCTLKDGTKMWVAGLEHDKHRKVDGRWLMSEMRLTTLLTAPYG